MQSNHFVKALDAYTDRLGVIEFQSILLDLNTLFTYQAISSLDESFINEEIDKVVAHLLSDKSHGPYGFNTDFVKKCWPIVKYCIYALWHAFIRGHMYVEHK